MIPKLRKHLKAIAGANQQLEALVDAEVEDSIDELQRRFEAASDEHTRDERLDNLTELVATAVQHLGVRPLDNVTVGTLESRSVDAFSDPFFGEANIIGVNIPVMIFAYLVAKATATFPLAESPFNSDAQGLQVSSRLQPRPPLVEPTYSLNCD